jgi:hypothetical protein
MSSDAVVVERGSVVLLSGYRRHGKDTFFRHLAGEDNRFSYAPFDRDSVFFEFPRERYKRLAFADVLKWECAATLNMTLEEIELRKDEQIPSEIKYMFKCTTPANNPPTVRDVLIDHGAYCRSLNVNYFCEKVASQLKEDADCVTVITDFRYENEYNFLKSALDGTGRRVVAVSIFRYGVPIPDRKEVSEHQLDDFPFDLKIVC